MAPRSDTDDEVEGTSIDCDRKRFVNALQRIIDPEDMQAFTRIIDDLIAWSRRQPGIAWYPRDGEQDIVRFCLAGTKPRRVFWSAYPRSSKRDAKLVAVQDKVPEVPTDIRDWMRKQFRELSRFNREGSNDVPTVSFRVLVNPENFKQVIRYLEEALHRIQESGATDR